MTGLQWPDFRTTSDFRKRHLTALSGLFVQVLKLCRKAGLVKRGHVALDGTKIKANASKHKAMSYGGMREAEPRLAAEVQQWLAKAGQADRAEDRQFGAGRRGDEKPQWVANKQQRLAKIRAAKAELEAEAKAAAAVRRGGGSDDDDNRSKPGRKPKLPLELPNEKAQRNFTDPDSRVLPTKGGFVQGYNAQATVDGQA